MNQQPQNWPKLKYMFNTVLERRPVDRGTYGASPRQPPSSPAQLNVDKMSVQMQEMQLCHSQETQGKVITQNLEHFGQCIDPSGINLQKLSQELNNVEIAYREIKAKLETARALCSYLAMMPGPIVTINTLKGIPTGTNAISRMNLWTALTLHLNTITQEAKRSKIMRELENTWTLQNLTNQGKQIDVYLCVFRQFVQETNMVPSPDTMNYKHYEDFIASLRDHVKKLVFQPSEILTLGVLFAHGRNCSKFDVVRRMLTMLHLALNIKVRNSMSTPNKAEAIVQYLQIGEEKDKEALTEEVIHIIGQHYCYTCPCPFHFDLNMPPNWLEFEKGCPNWNEVETELKGMHLETRYIPDAQVRTELEFKVQTIMARQLTNTFMLFQPLNAMDQEMYCKAHHLTYSREHMLILLIRLMDHFPNVDPDYVNMKLHKLEVINMQLCKCSHHRKFRELTQYKSSCVQSWTQFLKIHQREEDTPVRMRLGGMKRQHVLPQLWDCEKAGKDSAKYIPDRIKMASQGALVMSMINHMSPSHATMARMMWCVNNFTESQLRQNEDRLGKIWIQSASYRAFVRIFKSRPRGPSYGIQMVPSYHPSQMSPPVVPTIADLPTFSATTPPKKPRTESPIQIQIPQTPDQFGIPPPGQNLANLPLTAQNPPRPFHPNVPYALPNFTTLMPALMPASAAIPNATAMPGITAKRKVEENRSEALLSQILEQPEDFKVPYPVPKISSPARKVKPPQPPPGIRAQPLPPDQRHFPPGPQKAIRVPTKILRRRESEYERGSLRTQGGRPSQVCGNMIKEIDEVQQMQRVITAEEKAREKREQETNPQDPHVSSQQPDLSPQISSQQLEEEKSRVENSPPVSNHSQTSENLYPNLDLEQMMDETEVKTVHTPDSGKES